MPIEEKTHKPIEDSFQETQKYLQNCESLILGARSLRNTNVPKCIQMYVNAFFMYASLLGYLKEEANIIDFVEKFGFNKLLSVYGALIECSRTLDIGKGSDLFDKAKFLEEEIERIRYKN